jgi:cytochrome c oxidase accessory protein FixG
MENSGHSEEFRNRISTVNEKGKRVWVYPRKPKGNLLIWRSVVAYTLLLILFIMPFIKTNGHPVFLLNIFQRQFILFGIAFGPHDFYLFVLAFIAIVIGIVLFTAIYGRIFCGWICPQTIFMEMVFRKIEYFIEGDANKQRKLKTVPWGAAKIVKKVTKHTVFFVVAFIIANLLMTYLVGVDTLFKVISRPPIDHLTEFIAVCGFSGVFYFVFAFFREQACTIVCPYGRLQGVLLDKNSLVVAYDYVRGEPRGKLLKRGESKDGDCVDCHLCVDVCPTGIDIRDGIQLECVNCTACIDACNDVMVKINKPKGLIGYNSLNGIEERKKFTITPRIISYSAVLVILMTVLTILFLNRTDFSINILRTPGMLYQDQPGNKVSNLYNLYVVNKKFDESNLTLKLLNAEGEIKILGNDVMVKSQQTYEGRFMIVLDRSKLTSNVLNIPLIVGVYENNKKVAELTTSFLSHIGD